MVQLELWNGARGDHEKKVLRDFSHALPELPINDEVWRTSYDLARRARARGVTVPATDVVIAACARRHGASIETADKGFSSAGNRCLSVRRSGVAVGLFRESALC